MSIRVGTISALGAASLGLLAGPAVASDAGTLVTDTNALRASHGLPGYRLCPDLDGIAQEWAVHMAGTRSLAHNPDLADEMSGWEALAENVGDGGSAPVVETLFEQSPDHLANVVSTSYEEFGIGTARASNGTLWVDEVFRRPSGAACAGSAAPAAPVAPAVSATAVGGPPTSSAPPVVSPHASSTDPLPASPPVTSSTPLKRTAARLRLRVAEAQRAAIRARLTTGRAPGDVVGDALAFASLMRPVR